ncbi:hypothetical protein [Bradyrhizobium sp. P5_C11_2]
MAIAQQLTRRDIVCVVQQDDRSETLRSSALRASVKPDGQRSGRPVYRLSSALAALGLRDRRDHGTLPKPKRPVPRATDPLVVVFLGRVAQRGTHPDLSAPLLTVADAAEIYAVPEQTIITWLHAGAPVAQAAVIGRREKASC